MIAKRALGRTGLVTSVLGFGGNRLGEAPDRAEARATFERALERGVNLIDLADAYGHGETERLVGAWTRGRRDGLILCSKVGTRPAWSVRLGRWIDPIRRLRRGAVPRGGSGGRPYPRSSFAPRTIAAAVAGSLRRLGTDRLDVLYLHSPPPEVVADDAVLAALAHERDAGRVRFTGISFPGSATTDEVLAGVARPGVSIVQVRVSLASTVDLDRVAAAAAPAGVAVVAREPFLKGRLLDTTDASTLLRAVAQRRGVDAILVGTTRRDHLDENLAALAAPPLGDAEMRELWSRATVL